MIKIVYVLTPYYGEWKSVSGRGTRVEIELGDGVDGILHLGGQRVKIENGRGKLSISGMRCGQYTPYLLSKNGETELEPLILSHERITPAPTQDNVHRATLSRVGRLEEESKENKERIDELYTLIKGNALFS